ncbi:MAG: protein kinase [Verrucomicrobiota bacterium]
MNETYRCPKCGQPVPKDAPEGLCPRCVGALNLDSETGLAGSAAAAAPPPPSAQELAPHFPQLEILEVIGKGGMGVVYKVRQKELERVAALKILPPGIGGDPAFAERFAREAKALARLNHPGIVTIYDSGRTGGLFYFLMECVDGVSLGRLMRAGRMAPREALAIVPQLCDALQYAHDQGIVHRDIKPENILLDRQGRVKVADFGLAKLLGTGNESAAARGAGPAPSPSLTGAGKVVGTPQYMAPEQAEHPAEVDHRADIYALGVVFYQMLTGELPGSRLEAPSRKVQIDVRLDEVVLRALEKEPERRYQQVSQVKTAVETILQTAAPDALEGGAAPERGVKQEVTEKTEKLDALKGKAGPKGGATASKAPTAGSAEAAPRSWASRLRSAWSNWLAASSADGDKIQAFLHEIATPSNARTGSCAGGWRRYAYAGIAAGIAAALALWFCLHVVLRSPGPAVETLSQHRFQQLLDSNQIAECRINYNPQNPALDAIEGKYYKTDAEGKRLPESDPRAKVPFRAGVRLYPELEKRLLQLQQFRPYEGTRNPSPVKQVSAATAHKGDIGVWLGAMGTVYPLGTVESSNSVMFMIPQDYCQEVVRKFDAHQALTVEAYDRQGEKKFGHGFLAGLDNQIDTQTGTLKCRARLIPEGDNLMIPGLFLGIRMLLETRHGVTLVPAEAIQRDAQSAFVWVIQSDDRVSRRPVDEVPAKGGEEACIALEGGKWTGIHSGLSPGEVVVSGGTRDLRQGQKVRYDLAR